MPLYPEVLLGEAHFPPFAQARPPSWGLLGVGGPEHLGWSAPHSALAPMKPLTQREPRAHLYDPERTYLQSEMMNFSWIWPANFLPDLAQYTSASTLRMEMFCWKQGPGAAR